MIIYYIPIFWRINYLTLQNIENLIQLSDNTFIKRLKSFWRKA
jgi:hypothetical protein